MPFSFTSSPATLDTNRLHAQSHSGFTYTPRADGDLIRVYRILITVGDAASVVQQHNSATNFATALHVTACHMLNVIATLNLNSAVTLNVKQTTRACVSLLVFFKCLIWCVTIENNWTRLGHSTHDNNMCTIERH